MPGNTSHDDYQIFPVEIQQRSPPWSETECGDYLKDKAPALIASNANSIFVPGKATSPIAADNEPLEQDAAQGLERYAYALENNHNNLSAD